jgi:nucleotide-binding universal stress UspA family protein
MTNETHGGGPVLVPLDGSEAAEAALGTALSLARALKAPVHFLGVDDIRPLVEQVLLEETATEHWLGSYFGDLLARLPPGAEPPPTTVLVGDPANQIIKHAQRTGARLIVMSTHGRGGLSRLWLGSVTDRVVRSAHVPVVTVRAETAPGGGSIGDHPIRRLLLPLDTSGSGESALEWATTIAVAAEADVHLLSIAAANDALYGTPYRESIPNLQALIDGLEKEAETYLETVAGRLKRQNLAVTTHVSRERPAAGEIVEYAKQQGVSMIVMATHGTGALTRALLGSVADKVVRTASVPVLLVPPRATDA